MGIVVSDGVPRGPWDICVDRYFRTRAVTDQEVFRLPLCSSPLSGP